MLRRHWILTFYIFFAFLFPSFSLLSSPLGSNDDDASERTRLDGQGNDDWDDDDGELDQQYMYVQSYVLSSNIHSMVPPKWKFTTANSI